ncbi:MAG: dihydrolipoyllysine-residue acetyltransferase [Gammaproteobacteria bacterium]|nr:dihydrolipoyllysine-residue acetyltransferase [Gammaproteobacteria bacterium]MBU2057932.1 dihydrolipoyllysine-residue acetyltransferase [Gammaproteobacteria bacterium]MBU2174284.1 dihydrolipoyllysine-residue acetyltransferase [Gammaproteobacteria bacterium]MBU2247766.1 dihydrolipoyllysine-residue acetyltransferase [Gammaproteobacteria bacterium]MBU2344291.1 dihydrolipoyllysine-residue acetyltransferase [Gammaproteobacteria bacterium]
MKKDFILPDIGEGIVECEIVEWLVKEGDRISEDQPVCDVMTDKALVQIPAVYDGVVTKLYYAKGDIAKVHAPLFEMDTDGAAPAVAASSAPAQTAPAAVATGKQLEDFILPDIGEGIVECEIVEWLIKEGDVLAEDQPVCDVMTDKALVQIPAKYAGKVVKLHYAKGEIAKVHSPLFQQEIAGASTSAVAVVAAPVAAPVCAAKAAVAAASTAAPAGNGKALASPAVRRLARELSIDLSLVPGSGDKGRVYKDDVKAYANGGAAKAVIAPVKAPVAAAVVSSAGGSRVEPIKGIKAAMARQMLDSVSTIPHFTYCEEIDLTELIALRSQLKDQYARQGIKLTLMPFFMKAMSLAIKQFPIMNSQVNSDCSELTYFDDHNIGIAVDSKVGLLVPNIKGCQSKSIVQIAQELTKLTEAAREGRVSPAELKGGTITISNIGAIGGTVATPIINKPEVAIVALGKTQLLPRFNAKGEVEGRSLMQISWSGDHRVIDGGTIARFTNLWKSYLEQPSSMLLSMV